MPISCRHTLRRGGDRAEAIAREALGRDPKQPRMVRLRAQALLKGGKAAPKRRAARSRGGQGADNRELVVGLADFYAEQKRTADAVRLLEQARKSFGDDQAIAMRIANVYEAAGQLDDGRAGAAPA